MSSAVPRLGKMALLNSRRWVGAWSGRRKWKGRQGRIEQAVSIQGDSQPGSGDVVAVYLRASQCRVRGMR